MELLAIDPGETTGWASLFNGSPGEMGEMPYEEFSPWLADKRPSILLYENYIIRPAPVAKGYAHQWDKGIALRVIGAVIHHGCLFGIPVEHQGSGILKPGHAMFDLPDPSNRNLPYRDAIAAMIHARFWWQKNGRRISSNGKSLGPK